jgi:asparagine synthase (glutamine-hydrolysing)
MCGIFVSVGCAPDAKRIDRVNHRGPDGRGWQTFESPAGPVALGHRRLAIIDLTDAGHQPMHDARGKSWIVFNGAIYNYRELRGELELTGRKFRSQTDTEVLLQAYQEWGEEALDRLRGMFAFVIWNDEKKVLFAARDRFGIKPLYFYAGSGGLGLASEIKQIIDMPGGSVRMNVSRVYDFLAAGMADHTDETMFAQLRSLRGGQSFTLDLTRWRPGDDVPVRTWYRFDYRRRIAISEEEAAARFGELLNDAVRLHLRSDVKIGSCLSGGLDSSSIVCLMAPMLANGSRLNSVTACFAEPEVDERRFASAVVETAGTQPSYVFPRPEDAIELAEKITWHQDEPYGSTSIFAQWSVFSKARENGIKVMLDGQGADEQLAGYHAGFDIHMASLLRQAQLAKVYRMLVERRRVHGVATSTQLARMAAALLPRRAKRLVDRQRNSKSLSWLSSDLLIDYHRHPAVDRALSSAELRSVGDLGEWCVFLIRSASLGMLLHWEDRNSMANGVEARVPFLDHPLVEFTIALGASHKIVGIDTKRVLRRAMKGIVPAAVLDRRDKIGFSTPESSWFRGPLRSLLGGGIEDALSLYPGLLNATAIRKFAGEVIDGQRPFDMALWRVVNLGVWGRVFGATA